MSSVQLPRDQFPISFTHETVFLFPQLEDRFPPAGSLFLCLFSALHRLQTFNCLFRYAMTAASHVFYYLEAQ